MSSVRKKVKWRESDESEEELETECDRLYHEDDLATGDPLTPLATGKSLCEGAYAIFGDLVAHWHRQR